jgi:S1-C subfamily serine protease
MTSKKKFNLFASVVLANLVFIPATAQTPAPSPAKPQSPVKAQSVPETNRVILENKLAAPQVVTILHRLNGLKVLSLLMRSREEVDSIAKLDEAFKLAGDVHTNVIAGLALDDGQTIAAWLPEAEAEMPPPQNLFVPRAPRPPRTPSSTPPGAKGTASPVPVVAPAPEVSTSVYGPAAIQGVPGEFKYRAEFSLPADLRIITRDGKRVTGRYIGLDGLTGLSLITVADANLPTKAAPKEDVVVVGQLLRVVGPQPAPAGEAPGRSPLYIRIGETEAVVVKISRSPSGGIARVRVKSPRFTPANIGGIAINEKNETLGIVDGVEGGEATIVPMSLVRMAAKRVVARQASVPRPWLGIKGEPVGSVPLERITRVGWEVERARELTSKKQGILLTSVVPGSPAALAKLKPGDIILSVNNGFIRDAEEFSWLLDEAGPESPVLFGVARPEKEIAEAMEIKLSESPDPFFGLRTNVEKQVRKVYKARHTMLGEGIQTVALKPQAASRFGSSGGVLVLAVEPSTDAYKAGLRPGDVIETINGKSLNAETGSYSFVFTPGVPSNCVVIRNNQKITLTIQYGNDHDEPKQP